MLGLVARLPSTRSGNRRRILSHRTRTVSKERTRNRVSREVNASIISDEGYHSHCLRRVSLSNEKIWRRLSPSVDSSSREIQFHTSARNVLANSDDLWQLIVTRKHFRGLIARVIAQIHRAEGEVATNWLSMRG